MDDIHKNMDQSMQYDPYIEDIKNYNINKPTKLNNLQYEIIEQEPEVCNIENEINNEQDNSKELAIKLKLLSKNLHNDLINNDHGYCFWCTCEFNTQAIFIPKHKINKSYKCYGFFCTPQCAAGYLFNEHIDTSVKYERYQLLNYIYQSVYEYEKNIIPAPKPYYLLDKYCGNLTIEEYRQMISQDKLILLMDKPLSRNYPELFEENNEFNVHTINTFSKQKQKTQKKSIFHT